ncbi:hypothetical protein PVK06_009397 [Gossypium arboreum]|uniref:Uncharacterized protein n=1 Tax=Gossypium arboreum TaxID=29729 RepID=A0ABR0QMC9_GOSAR|nr:hypothetical protein PVK06_009397 [Gossypium arboreum]
MIHTNESTGRQRCHINIKQIGLTEDEDQEQKPIKTRKETQAPSRRENDPQIKQNPSLPQLDDRRSRG